MDSIRSRKFTAFRLYFIVFLFFSCLFLSSNIFPFFSLFSFNIFPFFSLFHFIFKLICVVCVKVCCLSWRLTGALSCLGALFCLGALSCLGALLCLGALSCLGVLSCLFACMFGRASFVFALDFLARSPLGALVSAVIEELRVRFCSFNGFALLFPVLACPVGGCLFV